MSKFFSPQTGGFYDSVIHGNQIPGDVIEIDNKKHLELINGLSNGKQIIVDENDLVALIDAPFNPNAAINSKNSEIRAAFQTAMLPITANYTAEDIASFQTQQAEATEWQADNTAETPLLDFMVANRPSIDKAELVSRILANAVIYKQIAGPAIGKKQHFEDLLYALKAQHEDPNQPDATQADFDAIVVDFS